MSDQQSESLDSARVAESVRRALLLVGPAEGRYEISHLPKVLQPSLGSPASTSSK